MVRTIIVDDEPLARGMIREYLADYDEVEVVAECGTGRQAVAAINEHAPDLVFLDVQMPGLDGFDVLERLDALPHIIFSTAYDAFALQAFEAGAVDYLLKPYNRSRFRKALRRALERIHAQPPDPERLLTLLQAARPQRDYLERLFVRLGDRIVPVATADIVWVEAAGDYSKLYTAAGSYLCNLGIGALAERLDPARFTRVHRSALIAVDALEHLVSDGEGGYIATLRDGTTVRVSRTYASAVRNLIL